MKKLIYLILFFLIVIVLWMAPDEESIKYSQISFGETIFNIEVAETGPERTKGLSGRDSLPDNSGLLFVFSNEDLYGIWMKEMNFSIDIIWLDSDLRVVSIKTDATPESYPEVFKPDTKSSFVLEINSGLTRKVGIKVGDLAKLF